MHWYTRTNEDTAEQRLNRWEWDTSAALNFEAIESRSDKRTSSTLSLSPPDAFQDALATCAEARALASGSYRTIQGWRSTSFSGRRLSGSFLMSCEA